MKTSVKLGLAALVLSVSFASCDFGLKSKKTPDSPAVKIDTTANKTIDTTKKADTGAKKTDTTAKK